jgi:GNAT superfamily N-acetyltransferase
MHRLEQLSKEPAQIIVRPMKEDDLHEADRIMRLAFGTFLKLPDPMMFMGDADYVRTRFRGDPSGAIVAEDGDRIVGSNFALDWGSVGIFGPLTIEPGYWDKGVAKLLLEETMKIFKKRGNSHLGLFTFAESSKHVHLYQKFGFWPQYLTAVMSNSVEKLLQEAQPRTATHSRYSQLSSGEKEHVIAKCRELCNGIYAGLDLAKEIRSVDMQKLGDTIFLERPQQEVVAFAISHVGAGTEAGSGNCYLKFGAVKGDNQGFFDELLDACAEYASSQRVSRLCAGVNTGRHNAYKAMIQRSFRTELQGISMHSPNFPGYDLPHVYAIDDWR